MITNLFMSSIHTLATEQKINCLFTTAGSLTGSIYLLLKSRQSVCVCVGEAGGGGGGGGEWVCFT